MVEDFSAMGIDSTAEMGTSHLITPAGRTSSVLSVLGVWWESGETSRNDTCPGEQYCITGKHLPTAVSR